MNIKYNITNLLENLPSGCGLVAVSKTHPVEKIQEAYEAGQRIFGENKAQELAHKYELLAHDIEWHMIGHLQRNKVRLIAPFVSLIHSVDSERLLEEINRQGEKLSRIIPCLLQVHIAVEETKYGFDLHDVPELLQREGFCKYAHVVIRGLMGMATLTTDEEKIRSEFRSLKKLFEELRSLPLPPNVSMTTLSMGMSNDYRIAVEEGSTLVRIGSAIFGDRKNH
ncbi:MAG TPA: YggS family pyridoxal phosphate-dependent enzyme [Cyclobacteriaceae bacterium]